MVGWNHEPKNCCPWGLRRPPCECWFFIRTLGREGPCLRGISSSGFLASRVDSKSSFFFIPFVQMIWLEALTLWRKCLLALREEEEPLAPSEVGGALPEAVFLQPCPTPADQLFVVMDEALVGSFCPLTARRQHPRFCWS